MIKCWGVPVHKRPTFAIGMETIARPGGSYLRTTYENMRRAGVFRAKEFRSIDVVDGKGKTRQQNGRDAIKAAVDAASTNGADWVIKLEDDLDFTDNFLENVADWLEDWGHARVPMFSLGASFEFVSKSRFNPNETNIFENNLDLGPGVRGIASPSFPRVRDALARGEAIMPHSVRGYWGAQALVWRAEVARQLVAWLGPDPYLDDGKEQHRHRGHDLMLQRWGAEQGAGHFGVAIPAFVQHIGERSNLDQPEINHKQPFFQFPFAGHDYRYQRRK